MYATYSFLDSNSRHGVGVGIHISRAEGVGASVSRAGRIGMVISEERGRRGEGA